MHTITRTPTALIISLSHTMLWMLLFTASWGLAFAVTPAPQFTPTYRLHILPHPLRLKIDVDDLRRAITGNASQTAQAVPSVGRSPVH